MNERDFKDMIFLKQLSILFLAVVFCSACASPIATPSTEGSALSETKGTHGTLYIYNSLKAANAYIALNTVSKNLEKFPAAYEAIGFAQTVSNPVQKDVILRGRLYNFGAFKIDNRYPHNLSRINTGGENLAFSALAVVDNRAGITIPLKGDKDFFKTIEGVSKNFDAKGVAFFFSGAVNSLNTVLISEKNTLLKLPVKTNAIGFLQGIYMTSEENKNSVGHKDAPICFFRDGEKTGGRVSSITNAKGSLRVFPIKEVIKYTPKIKSEIIGKKIILTNESQLHYESIRANITFSDKTKATTNLGALPKNGKCETEFETAIESVIVNFEDIHILQKD